MYTEVCSHKCLCEYILLQCVYNIYDIYTYKISMYIYYAYMYNVTLCAYKHISICMYI